MAWVGAVHDRQVHQPLAQPARRGVGRLQDPRALAGRDALEDGRAVVGTALGSAGRPGRSGRGCGPALPR